MEKISFNKENNVSPNINNKKEGIVNNIGKLGKKIVLGAAIVGATLTAEKASSQTTPDRQNEQTEHSIEETNKMKWETETMKRLKDDIKELKTERDINTFELLILRPFMYNIGMLGAEKEVKSDYSLEQYKKMFLDIKEIEKTFESIEKKFNVEQTGGVSSEIIHLKQILEMRTSYSGFHEYKKLYNLEK